MPHGKVADILAQVALAAGSKEDVGEMLENVLGPGDQAWVVCAFDDCNHFVKGRCTIFTIKTKPETKPGQPCDRYERRA